MTVTQTVDIPANRLITLEVPPELPMGRVVLTFSPAGEKESNCPLCAKSHIPNAETAAAIREGRAMMRGEVPAKRFNSLDEMWDDLVKDYSDD